MGVCLELAPSGVDSQRCLASQLCYLQVVVKRADGVLADDITLLFLQSQGQRPVHILTHQPFGSTIAPQTRQARRDNQCKKHYDGISLFHTAKLQKES
jgi:hypothetical protein